MSIRSAQRHFSAGSSGRSDDAYDRDPARYRDTKGDTANGTPDYSMVVNGRYVGDASALDNKKDVDQVISDQYLILEQADQNAA